PALAQARQQRARAPVVGARADGGVVQALADPALVGRALGAQLADVAPRAAREEDLGLLAAQQRAAADVAGDDRGARADRLPGHGHPALAGPRADASTMR